jgi:hypothetical protein
MLDFEEKNPRRLRKILSVRKEIISIGMYPLKKIFYTLLKLFITNALWDCITQKNQGLRQKVEDFLNKKKYYEIFKGNTECFFNKHINNLQICCHI